jgi:hypothetical protein
MSLQIKSLTIGAPTIDNSLAAPNDNFNIIPTANTVYDLYTAANDATNKVFKAAVVSTIRLLNTHATSTVKVTLYFMRPNASGQNRRRLLSPPDIALIPGFTYFDDGEITLEPGDRIQAKADVANAVQYLISGVERDVA